jgi:hypothetical protein
MFPNRFSQWRNVEIMSFIEHFETDILIYKIENFAGINFDFDIEHPIFDSIRQQYNILIFDPKFNYLNRHNTRVDGTKFNNKFGGSYLLSRGTDFNLYDYDLTYHIFLKMFNDFNSTYTFPKGRQVIHLYPGGGMSRRESVSMLDPNVRVVTTHPDITEWSSGFEHIECPMGTFLKNGQDLLTNQAKERFGVCFASLGHGTSKGEREYRTIVDNYKFRFQSDKIDFYAIGNCGKSVNLTLLDAMDYVSLGNFYREKIDLFLNLETGLELNGWPLGVEAAIQGSVLLTTDTRQSHGKFQTPINTIYVPRSLDDFGKTIRSFYNNPKMLTEYSQNTKAYLKEKISYENQQLKIFDFLKSL